LHQRAAKVIDALRSSLDEAMLAREIDEPLDRATEAFLAERDLPFSVGSFRAETAAYVQRLYREVLPGVRELSNAQAADAAAALLDQTYEGTCSNGYWGALADTADPAIGLAEMIRRFAQFIKLWRRRLRTTSALARVLEQVDWETRVAAAQAMMDTLHGILPPSLEQRPPCAFVDDLADLLALVLAAEEEWGTLTNPALPT